MTMALKRQSLSNIKQYCIGTASDKIELDRVILEL